MKREISAGIIIYRLVDREPKFLLLYHGGRYWNFPKGHLEEIPPTLIKGQPDLSKRETSVGAAFRETEEETGLKQNQLFLKKGFKAFQRYRFLKGKTLVFKIVIFFLAETKKREIRISREHEGYGWFFYKEALLLAGRYKANQEILKKAFEFVRLQRKTSS